MSRSNQLVCSCEWLLDKNRNMPCRLNEYIWSKPRRAGCQHSLAWHVVFSLPHQVVFAVKLRLRVRMGRETPEIEPGQLKMYLSRLLFWHAMIWKLPLIFFCGVNCGFHAIRESFPGSEIYLWMTSLFNVLPVE